MHFYTIKPLYLRNSNLDFREGFRAIVAIVKTLVIQPCFQKNTISPWHSNLNNPLSLGFMWRIYHISNNAPFIPIYFASETWLLKKHPHFSTCKILQICSLWKWVPTYVVECQTVRQLAHNCIRPGGTANINVSEEGETAVISANFLSFSHMGPFILMARYNSLGLHC